MQRLDADDAVIECIAQRLDRQRVLVDLHGCAELAVGARAAALQVHGQLPQRAVGDD